MPVAAAPSPLSLPFYLLLHLKTLPYGNCRLTFPSKVCLLQEPTLILLFSFSWVRKSYALGMHVSIIPAQPSIQIFLMGPGQHLRASVLN